MIAIRRWDFTRDIYARTHIQTHIYARTHTHTHTHTQFYTPTYICTHTYILGRHVSLYTYVYTHTHTHRHTHTHIQTHTHTHTHTHYTLSCQQSVSNQPSNNTHTNTQYTQGRGNTQESTLKDTHILPDGHTVQCRFNLHTSSYAIIINTLIVGITGKTRHTLQSCTFYRERKSC